MLCAFEKIHTTGERKRISLSRTAHLYFKGLDELLASLDEGKGGYQLLYLREVSYSRPLSKEKLAIRLVRVRLYPID